MRTNLVTFIYFPKKANGRVYRITRRFDTEREFEEIAGAQIKVFGPADRTEIQRGIEISQDDLKSGSVSHAFGGKASKSASPP